MGHAFWIGRFFAATSLIFVALLAVELLKGHDLQAALLFSLTWSLLSGGIFTGARIYRFRKGQHCALCDDLPKPK